jgi:hypothetical protein
VKLEKRKFLQVHGYVPWKKYENKLWATYGTQGFQMRKAFYRAKLSGM